MQVKIPCVQFGGLRSWVKKNFGWNGLAGETGNQRFFFEASVHM